MSELVRRAITGAVFGFVFIFTYFYLPPIALTVLFLGILCEILIVEWPQLINTHKVISWLFTLVYPVLPFGLLIAINHHAVGRPLLFILFAMVWSYDVGAYGTGKMLGKHKLMPKVSPSKTWEGFIGGIISCMFILAAFLYYHSVPFSFAELTCVSLTVCITGTAGDLFESLLKRKAGIKDTGSILPGHGGFLDRFDSALFVSVPFFIYCFFFLNS